MRARSSPDVALQVPHPRWLCCPRVRFVRESRVRARTCRSDMDFMFGFFTRMAEDDLCMKDLHFCSHKTFRAHVDKLCGQAGSGWRRVKLPVEVPGFPHLQLPDVELVYRDAVQMLRGFLRAFAKAEEFCWRWAAVEEKTAAGERTIEHPCTAAWWREQAEAVGRLGGSLLAMQIYSDDTTLNAMGSRSAYPVYALPLNGSFDLYKLLFPVSVLAYLPVLSCPLRGEGHHALHPHTRGATAISAVHACAVQREGSHAAVLNAHRTPRRAEADRARKGRVAHHQSAPARDLPRHRVRGDEEAELHRFRRRLRRRRPAHRVPRPALVRVRHAGGSAVGGVHGLARRLLQL